MSANEAGKKFGYLWSHGVVVASSCKRPAQTSYPTRGFINSDYVA